MNAKKRLWLLVIVALLGFACAPTLSLGPVPTLDPSSMGTAIVQTADAASAQTAAAGLGLPPTSAELIVAQGPTLDTQSLGTAIALTSDAAAAQTQALIPNTLTPSVTPFPTWTPSITPSPTRTFVITLPPTFTTPVPPATKKPKTPGDNGGDIVLPYECKQMRVTPKNETVLPKNTQFDVVWIIKNKGQNWPGGTARIEYVEGTLIPITNPNNLPVLSPYIISGGDVVTLPTISLKTPDKAGYYATVWRVSVEYFPACNLQLTVIVQ